MSIHDAARLGFERQADAYERGRPPYPAEAIAWLIERLGLAPGGTAVDVGAGTGKLTRTLLGSGAEVIAVEPVGGMRAVLERELPDVRALEGTAEALPFPDATVDAIVVGQAFHWFNAPAALAEFHRVLRTGGRLGLIWNVRDRNQQLQRAISELTEPLRGGAPSQGAGPWRGEMEATELFTAAGELRLPYEVVVNPDRAIDRIGSVSFIAALGDPQRERVLQQVRRLAEEHPEPWAYVTEAYVYERAGAAGPAAEEA